MSSVGLRQRWEWRTFGERFGGTIAAFESLTATGTQESDEVYLLVGDAQNVKIRDGLVDIKLLREVDVNGLQRWEPVLKVALPLDSAATREVANVLGIQVAEGRTAAHVDDLADLLSGAGPVSRSVQVHKRRVRYVV